MASERKLRADGRLRVAMFSRFPRDPDCPRGGIESVTVTLARALGRRAEVDLHLLTLERAVKQVEVSQAGPVTVHRLPGGRCPQMMDIIAGPGHWRLKRHVNRLAADVVHSHESHGLCMGRLPVPHVFTLHGFDHANIPAEGRALQWLRSPLWRRIERWGLAHQTHIISITPYVRNAIQSLTGARIHDIDNPVCLPFFQIRRREVPGRVFFSGWISSRKNPLTVLRAVAKVIRRGVRVSVHLAGEEKDPAYARTVHEAIGELGISAQTVMLGRIPQSDIRRELAEAAAFVLPSLQENAPMAIAEAMAAGVPVISTSRCGMPYMIEDGQSGYLVEPDDVDGLAEKLTGLLAHDSLRRRMGARAGQVARARFHPDVVASKTFDVYREMTKSVGRAACAANRVGIAL